MSQIQVEISTSLEGLIHMLTADRATCIVFFTNDLPHGDSNHTLSLNIFVGCSGHRVPSVLLDYGSTLNVCLLATTVVVGFEPSDFESSSQQFEPMTIHAERVITIQSTGDSYSTSVPVLEISHGDDDLFLTGFTFDEIQTVEVDQFCRDHAALSFDEHGSTVERVKARLTHTPFDYLVCPYNMSFPDYFVRAPELQTHSDGIIEGFSIIQEVKLQRLVHPLQLSNGAPDTYASTLVAPSFLDHMSLMTLYFPDKIDGIVQPELALPFDLFRVSVIEVAEEIHIAPTLEFSNDERDGLAQLLRSYLDVYAWSYEDMSGLDPSIVNEEIQKQLSIGFLSMVEYPEWLANVIPISKNEGKVRVCVDFRDLNKASPNDDFSLPHIDMLVDSIVDHLILSFMDKFSRYIQILMALEDMEKMSFITEWGTYCYRVMSFGLKNVGATYQRATTTIFQDMMHWDVKFRLRLNPKKCTFGVTSGKLLGYMVSERGIEVDSYKIRVILDMPAPRTESEIRGFLGRLQYINRFIARLIDICEPIFRLLRKSQPTVWDDQCYLGRSPRMHVSLARCFGKGANYLLFELRHYITEYSVHLISRLDPLRYSFDRPTLVGRLMRWLVLLTEFDIHYVTQKFIRGNIIVDHLASLPVLMVERLMMTFQIRSGSQQSNASNGSQIRVEMKKLEPMEADHSKLKANFAGLRNQPLACEISLRLRNDFAAILFVCEISQPFCTPAKFS
ncbi:Transposon Ty3-G Gag-Pol polyprotein [Vitis vinifera]|uniref:Transposon Ty3-G Gag-Pol polyprotein n=1 Tax=Vitis vinifera TaxID=29760 RepID=A0A438GAL8_VITVI|nr:Transposon Ty3-G Gag-Pol polyprotein [Vitis vinifera]